MHINACSSISASPPALIIGASVIAVIFIIAFGIYRVCFDHSNNVTLEFPCLGGEEEREKMRKRRKGEGRGWCLDPGRLSQTSVAEGPRGHCSRLLCCSALGDPGPVWIGPGRGCVLNGSAPSSARSRLLGLFRTGALLSLGVPGPEELRSHFPCLFHSYSLPPSFLNFSFFCLHSNPCCLNDQLNRFLLVTNHGYI